MKEVLTWITENWALLVAGVAIVVVAIKGIQSFRNLPTETQISKVKECLLNWVVEAERELGGGTGKVKLSMVYGWFVTAFPILKNFISFETFSVWVDEALEEMENMLSTNENLKTAVQGITLESITEIITPTESEETNNGN